MHQGAFVRVDLWKRRREANDEVVWHNSILGKWGEWKGQNVVSFPDEFHGPVLSYMEEEDRNKSWKCSFSQRVLWKFGSSGQNCNTELGKRSIFIFWIVTETLWARTKGTKHLINIYYIWPLHCFYLLAGSGPHISLRELLLPHSQLARLGWSCPSSGGRMPRTWLVQPHIPQSERLGQRGTHDTKQPVRLNSRTLPEIIKEDTSCYFIYHRQ